MVLQMPYAEETLPFFHSCSLFVCSGFTSSLWAMASHCELTFGWVSVVATSRLRRCRLCHPSCQHDRRSLELDARPCGDSPPRQAQVSPSHQVTPARSLLTSSISESPANVTGSCFAFSTKFPIKRLNSDSTIHTHCLPPPCSGAVTFTERREMGVWEEACPKLSQQGYLAPVYQNLVENLLLQHSHLSQPSFHNQQKN